MSKLKDKIFHQLKMKDGLNVDELAYNIKETKKEIQLCLDVMEKKGWIAKKNGGYHVIRKLDKPLKPEPKNKYWEFERLQGASTRPKRFLNPYFTMIPHSDQDGRGTCCGHAGSYCAQFLQYKLNNVTPEAKEVPVERDREVNISDICTAVFDIYPDYTPSQQGLYDDSREYANVQYPEGSYISAIMAVWKEWGYNFEKDRMTSKTNSCVVPYYPLKGTQAETIAFLKDQAKDHKADGYAKVTTWEGLKDAINKYGCVLCAINIFENYGDDNCVGNFPDPRGEVVGSHAMCAYGYDDDLEEVYFIHSWGDAWTKQGGCSKKYWTMAAGTAFAPIDSEDKIKAETLYAKLKVTCNVDCVISVGTDTFTGKEYAAMLEVGKEYTVSAKPVNEKWYGKETYSTTGVMPKEGWNIDYSFPKKSITEYIKDLIKDILDRIFNR